MTRDTPIRHHRSRLFSNLFAKRWLVPATILLLLIAFRLYLPYFAKNYINDQLNRDPEFRGGVTEVRIHLWRGAYTLIGLDLQSVKGQKEFPLVSAGQIDIGVSWKELVHGAVRARIEIRDLVVNIVQEQAGEKKTVVAGAATKEGKKEEASDWKTVFKNLVPLDVGRLAIDGKSLHYRDLTAQPRVDVFLDQLEVRGENLTNSAKMSKSLFGRIELRARAMDSGKLHIALRIDPLASPPDFKMSTQLERLDLTKLNNFFTAYGSFDVKQGTISVYSEVASSDNRIKGYVKPIIKDLSVLDLKKDLKKGGVLHAAWQAVVGAIGGIFKNHKKDQQAAEIPFEGRLDDPQTSTWKTLTSVLSNTFVKPIAPALDHSVDLKDIKRK